MSRRHPRPLSHQFPGLPEGHDLAPRRLLSLGSPVPLTPTEAEVFDSLRPLVSAYPGILRWFQDKVVPGLRTDARRLEVIRKHGQIVAIGIAKRDEQEQKLCTVRVLPSFQGQGLGCRVIDPLLRWLDCDQPFCTVSEATRPQFDRIFEYYGFTQTSSHAGLYVPNRVEQVFNAKTRPHV